MVRAGLLAMALAGASAPGATAQEPGRLAFDLNRLDDADGACRLTFVADNGWAPLARLVLETVLFDRAGRVARLTLFDFGALPRNRRRVRQFDMAGIACADLAQVLVNGVSARAAEGSEAGPDT